ncbi:CUT1 family carbohydrate ABC transporter membrane protein 1 [Neobacillus bataviensis LMG 21833]|uniref:CUT1 family carbohydrate ABC transporter membrane protein 1 n=1 Tax=Neobacillus bataviensis LMG 21833 TaxID=1117379 RepID=K6DA64_9BACI|nr:sugar ABC transporter permease [Neobacillus bataviensis]EKN65204.1 CUT1 family carbohydrate ABC transporter membrane protein 1 [Neobacillus bataviensis LMG 21833]
MSNAEGGTQLRNAEYVPSNEGIDLIQPDSAQRETAFQRWKEKSRRLGKQVKENRISYLFLAPFALIFSVFYVLPVIISIGLSFTYYNILEPPKFIGWQNYLNLFVSDDLFIKSIKTTFLFAFITGPIGYIGSFLFAWFINELPRKVRTILVVVFYAPSLSGQVFVIWGIIFSGDQYGFINGFLMKIGILKEPIQWFTNPDYMLPALFIVILWTSVGAGFLAFVAGLQTLDKSLFEAGYIDGVSNRWQELWFITLPQMRPQLMFGAILTITGSFAIHDVIVPLAGFPSTDYAAHTIVSHLVDFGTIRFEMGYASAIATLLFLVMITCNILIQKILKRVGT